MADENSQLYSFDGKVTIWSDMTTPKKKSSCPTLLLSYQQDCCHWTFLRSVKCWRSHRVRVCCEERESAAVVWSSCFHRSRPATLVWYPTSRRQCPNGCNVAVPLPKERVVWTLQILIRLNAILLLHRCLRIWALPKASTRSVTAVRHYRVLGQSGNVVGGASVCSQSICVSLACLQ